MWFMASQWPLAPASHLAGAGGSPMPQPSNHWGTFTWDEPQQTGPLWKDKTLIIVHSQSAVITVDKAVWYIGQAKCTVQQKDKMALNSEGILLTVVLFTWASCQAACPSMVRDNTKWLLSDQTLIRTEKCPYLSHQLQRSTKLRENNLRLLCRNRH